MLAGCGTLLLECNHDPKMLAASTYPPFLKRRVGGAWGHLANEAAAAIAQAIRPRGLKQVVAAHLSEQNNRPELARQALAAAMGCVEADIQVADGASGCGWLTCSSGALAAPIKKAARGRLFRESEGPITWRRWRRQRRSGGSRQRSGSGGGSGSSGSGSVSSGGGSGSGEREPGAGAAAGAGAPEQAPALPSCHKRPGLRLQSGSPIRAISSFQVSFYGSRTISGNCQCRRIGR